MVREKLRTTATAVRGRAYDVVARRQAAMPEQMLAPEPADPEHDDQDTNTKPTTTLNTSPDRRLDNA